jgi:beta-glucosidase
LFGDVNPGGRLTQTWPRRLDDLPDKMDYDIRHGRTYMYFKGEPLYPFGYGLSYTPFAYSNLRAESNVKTGAVSVNIDVKNTGSREGDEVVQVYVSYSQSNVERPLQQLVAFQRVTIGAGQTTNVKLPFKVKQLDSWDAKKHKFVGEAGEIAVMVGSSSRDIKLKRSVRIAGSVRE